MQLLALVIAAAIGCFISCASEAVNSPNMLTRLMCARSASSCRSFSRSCSAHLRSVMSVELKLFQIARGGKDRMTNRVDPFHFSIRNENSELHLVIGFFAIARSIVPFHLERSSGWMRSRRFSQAGGPSVGSKL